MGSITRLLPTPERRFHRIVAHRDLVFLSGVTDPLASSDIEAQTASVLARIEELLQAGGSDKEHILSAMIWLSDISLFARMNAVWDQWVAPDHAPARATVEARLARPELLIEIGITAARRPRNVLWWW